MARDNKLYAHCSEKPIKYNVDENGCHICISHKFDSNGYPRIRRNGKSMLMSRYIYEQQNGKIPDGLLIRHKCDNPNCINVNHLEIGNFHDNMQDMADRGRMYMPTAKLREEQIRLIRIRIKEGYSDSKIAEEFNVSDTTIFNIRHKKSWKSVD